MNKTKQGTEKLILEAAKIVFIEKGFEGTTMQQIAAEAGINKALLHYYFRNKNRLFEAVFFEAFQKMLPNISQVMTADLNLFGKIELFVDIYITGLQNYPQIPLFILHELHRNPDRVIELVKNSGIRPGIFIEQIKEEIRKGTIINIDPMQLLVNMLGLCIFPVAARPMIQGFLMNNDVSMYDRFLESRKKEVAQFIINAIKNR
jgi:TetR/AcrR family transcriptional regulator